MRFSTIVPAAFALTAPIASVAAAGQIGFSLGVKKADGTCKFQADYEADMDTMKSVSTTVRVYSASDCNTAQYLLPAAKNKGFKVILGVWPSSGTSNDPQFDRELATLKQYATQFTSTIAAVTVGSEALYRKDMTADQLVTKINAVKQILPTVKLGTADSWNKFNDGTADPVVKVSDIVLANAFAYWQGIDINAAPKTFVDDIYQALKHVQQVKGGKIDFWVGETGWPTVGNQYEAAVPSTQNAAKYYQNGICAIKKWGFNVFVFEAFDEPWKPDSVGQNGQAADEKHWGVWDSNRGQKYKFTC